MTRAVRAGLIKFALLTGAADSSTAGITCTAGDGTAISANDELIGVLELAQTTNAWTDTTASSSISTTKLLCPASANDVVAVWWMACDAGLQVDSPFVSAEVGAGALANVSITISGITEEDTLISVIEINASTGAWTDRTAASSIYAANAIRCTSSTNGNSVFVMWMDASPRAFAALNLQMRVGTIDSSPSTDPSSATVTGINSNDVPLVVLCVDETDYDALDELTSVTTVAADDTLTIDEPSPTASAGAKLLVFYQKSNDLDA
jgi:hypothetical protein